MIGYQEVYGFVNEDYTLTVTVGGSSPVSIAGWTLAGHLYAPNGTEIVGAVTVTITNAAAGTFTAAVTGQSLIATDYYAPYEYAIYRTDTGARTLVAWGPLIVQDPSTPPLG